MVSDMQKLARAEFLTQFAGDPDFNPKAIKRRVLEAASIDRIDEVMTDQPPPPPEAILAESNAKRNEAEIIKMAAEVRHKETQIAETIAKAVKAIAEAEAAEAGPQLTQYKTELDALMKLATTPRETANGKTDGGGVRPVAPAPINPEGAPVLAGLPTAPNGGMG